MILGPSIDFSTFAMSDVKVTTGILYNTHGIKRNLTVVSNMLFTVQYTSER